MSEKNEKKIEKESFFQQFIIFFLIITAVQVGFAYFGFSEYLFPKAEKDITDYDTPPVHMSDSSAPPAPIRLVTLDTEQLTISFNLATGQVHEVELNNYWTDSQHQNKISTLFQDISEGEEKSQGLFDELLIAHPDNSDVEKALPSHVTIDLGQNTALVTKKFDGFTTLTTYTVKDNNTIDKNITIQANEAIEFYSYTELRNKNTALVKGTEQGYRMFQGASFHTDKTRYTKIPFNKYGKKSFNEEANSGWIALSQRYFATAVATDGPATYYSNYLPKQKVCVAGYVSSLMSLPKGGEISLRSSIYTGPEDKVMLSQFAPDLQYVIDFGIFWPVCDLLLSGLIFLQGFLHDWGLSIIMLNIFMRTLLYVMGLPHQKAMAEMKRIQPQLDRLKKKHSDDDMAFNRAQWDLYKKENISYMSVMFGGLLSLFIQLPVFLGFYSLLLESITLRQTSFVGIISDLSLADPTYTLSGVLLLTSLVQQRLSPAVVNPDMAMIFKMMPYVFAFASTSFPSGLLIYWIASNIVTISQAICVTLFTNERNSKS